jgi:glycosyltransferase involved in cell wall biosynthesis
MILRQKELKIALVGPLPPPSGGMANQVLQLQKLLCTEDIQVETVQVNQPYRPSWIERIRGVRALFRFLPYLWELWRVAGRVDLVHIMANSGWSWHLFAAPAIWIAHLRGVTVILNYRGGEAEKFFSRSFFWVNLSMKKVDAIIVPSGFLEQIFKRYELTCHIVPNIIDLSRFHPAPCAYPDLQTAPRILVARNLEPIYDNASALRAFALIQQQYPLATLTIAGSGPEQSMLQNLAIDLGIHHSVSFTGRVDNQQMPFLYQQADIMLNPSLADNMPISVLEAMASGVVVVSTRVGGLPYLVEHNRTAILVPLQNPQEMAQAVLQLIQDDNKIRQMCNAGVESVKQYTWSQVRTKLFEVYLDALTKKSRWRVNSES